MVPHAWLEMNPIDAARLKHKPHDRVSVISRRSQVSNLELRITGIVGAAQVFMPFHFAESNSNLCMASSSCTPTTTFLLWVCC
jgi:assimilatory nitrate reductase catalytic subunit